MNKFGRYRTTDRCAIDPKSMQASIASAVGLHPIVAAVREGSLERAQYVAYLSDVYSYALHSAQVIAHAGTRLALSNNPLASYLFRHAQEELGHDEWVESDLRDLGLPQKEIESIKPSSPCRQMIALEYFHACHGNPVALFGWMYVLETLGGRMGGPVAQGIDNTLQLGGKGVYFLSAHGKADEHHAQDLTGVIVAGIVSPSDKRDFTYMMEDSLRLYLDILASAYNAGSNVEFLQIRKDWQSHGQQ